jgi:hypothetical protein
MRWTLGATARRLICVRDGVNVLARQFRNATARMRPSTQTCVHTCTSGPVEHLFIRMTVKFYSARDKKKLRSQRQVTDRWKPSQDARRPVEYRGTDNRPCTERQQPGWCAGKEAGRILDAHEHDPRQVLPHHAGMSAPWCWELVTGCEVRDCWLNSNAPPQLLQ